MASLCTTVADGPPEELLVHHARRGYVRVGPAILQQIAKVQGVEWKQGEPLADSHSAL